VEMDYVPEAMITLCKSSCGGIDETYSAGPFNRDLAFFLADESCWSRPNQPATMIEVVDSHSLQPWSLRTRM
jgi:hypothetical protein